MLRHAGRQLYRFTQTLRPCASLTSLIEGNAMVNGGSYDGQTNSHVDTADGFKITGFLIPGESCKFQRYVALIMVHCHDRIVRMASQLHEDRIGWNRSLDL